VVDVEEGSARDVMAQTFGIAGEHWVLQNAGHYEPASGNITNTSVAGTAGAAGVAGAAGANAASLPSDAAAATADVAAT